MAGISFIGADVILRDARARTALGIACRLAAWTIVAVSLILALVLVVLGWMEGVLDYAKHVADRPDKIGRATL
jgi:hypothetical protein